MARREHLDGLNRCGLPGLHSLEPPSVLEMLEHRAAQQDAIVQNLIIQNRRLLAIHQCLSQDRHNTEKEIQMVQADFGDAETLSDMQTREMVGKIRIMEAEIRAGAAVKKELHQVHLEADKLCAERQELTTEIQRLTEEVEKVEKSSEGKNSLPELHAEPDGLQKEYRSLRSVFEYKRDINTKQVEQMRTMEKNLIAMTKEADKLRAEVQNAKMRAQASAGQSGMAQAQAAPAGTEPYGSTYNNLPAAYQQATQACQSGMAHPPAPLAGIYHYASAYAYSPAAACQQATQAGPYTYAVPYEDANPMAYHQAVEASGYAGYPVAGYDQQHALSYYPGYPAGYGQNALSNYPAAYAAPQHTGAVNSGPASATDAANMYNGAGCPAREVQTSGGTVTVVAQAADPPSDGAYHPTPTGGAQM